MFRWFSSVVLALLLACFGFTAAAQGYADACPSGNRVDAPTTQSLQAQAAHDHSDHLPGDDQDDSPDTDEQRHECNELLTGTAGFFVPASVSDATSSASLTRWTWPFLEQPKRPPRG